MNAVFQAELQKIEKYMTYDKKNSAMEEIRRISKENMEL